MRPCTWSRLGSRRWCCRWPMIDVAPVDEVERAVGADVDAGRAEVGVAGGDQVCPSVVPCQARAFFGHLHAIDALEADHVAVEEVAPEFLGKRPAGDDAGAGAGARGRSQNSLHPVVLRRVVDMPAEGRAEVGVVAGGVGDDVVAPVVEDPAVRIGKAIGGVALEACRCSARSDRCRRLRCGPGRRRFRPACDGKRRR